jgi:cholesterol oxidase
LQFTERMKGWFSTRVGGSDYGGGWDRGQADDSSLTADLTITVNNLDALLDDPSIRSDLGGTVHAPQLSADALTVTEGEFRLFEPDPHQVETWRMRYRMRLASNDGGRYRFEGDKVLHDDPGFDVWEDTTKLFVRVLDESNGTSGAGILRLTPAGLIRQLQTLRVTREPDAKRRRRYVRRFLWMFAKQLVHTYGPLDEDGRFWGKGVERGPITLKDGSPPNLTLLYCAQDGWQRWPHDQPPRTGASLRLTRFEGGSKGPVMLAPGFAMSARSYAMGTNDTNLVSYLFHEGYDVWLFDYRACIELESAKELFTLDDIARDDWPTAVQEVRRRSGAEDVQVVCHCAGSVTFLMAMLDGLQGVRSAVCSQFTMYPHSWWVNRVKVRLPVPQLLQAVGIPSLSPNTKPTLFNQIIDIALWPVPVPHDERCGSALCRYLNLVYGMTHHHAQLNFETHRKLVASFGVGNILSIKHLGLIFRKGRVVNSEGEDIYLEHPERLAIPIHFLVGKSNTMFFPSTTHGTLHWLRRHNYPPTLYTINELENYAHLDCFIGENAARDVFPLVLENLEAHQPTMSEASLGAQ